MKILVLNSGSSSLKCCLYELAAPLPSEVPIPVWEGKIEGFDGSSQARIQMRNSAGQEFKETASGISPAGLIRRVVLNLWQGETAVLTSKDQIALVGHRVVHGGSEFHGPVRITPEIKLKIAGLRELAPAHNEINLQGIEAMEHLLGNVPQIAVFDTAFHVTLPTAAAVYPGPYEWFEQGIRRYGFHGINHEYCAQRAAKILGKDPCHLQLISCHLGNGCSLAAIQSGRSINTTMGFTPLEGLMMGSRSGSVDPGILTYLMREKGITAERMQVILNSESGLRGLSGFSGDMREIREAVEGHGSAERQTRAELAFEVYIHRLRFHIGAMLPSLQRLDALIFTAGVGENSPHVRSAACQGLQYLGIELDEAKNADNPRDADISLQGSKVRVLVIRAEEDWAIARQSFQLMSG